MQLDFPTNIIAGDSYEFVYSIPNYPSSEYSLTLALRGPEQFDKASISNSDDTYTINLSSADTTSLSTGNYKVIFYVENTDGLHKTIHTQTVLVEQNPINIAAGVDIRSHNQIMLDALNSYIEKKATNEQLDHLSSEIGDKKLTRMSILELLKLRDYYKGLVLKEKGLVPSLKLFSFTRTR